MSETEYNKVQVSWFANGGDQVVLRADSGEELKEVAEGVAKDMDDVMKAVGTIKQVQIAKGVFTGDNPKKNGGGEGKPRAADTPPPVTSGPPPSDNGKVYLNVPFSEKDEAKSAGARWDKDAKSWYVNSRSDAVSKWL